MIAKRYTGDRLTLRVPEKADYRFITDCMNEASARRLLGHSDPLRFAADRSVLTRLRHVVSRYLGVASESLLLVATVDGKDVGVASVHNIDYSNRNGEIVGCIHKEERGQGYGHELAEELVAYAFQELGLHKVRAQARADNPAAITVLEDIGMVRKGILDAEWLVDGVFHDVLLYELLRPDWKDSVA